jgi:hypothetical protein
MFNFASAQNVTNVRTIESVDVKVFANSKIRIGEDARILLGLQEKNVLIIKDAEGNVAIAGVSTEGEGRKVNNLGEFNHQALSGLLGGKNSEWTIDKETKLIHPITKDVYYPLSKSGSESSIAESIAEEDYEEANFDELVEQIEEV